MSVEYAHGYHSSDRVIHVFNGDTIVQPFGGYVPSRRLIGAAAVIDSADRWLADNPLTSPGSEGTPPSADKNVDEDPPDPFEHAIADGTERRQALEDDIEDLTTQAKALAA